MNLNLKTINELIIQAMKTKDTSMLSLFKMIKTKMIEFQKAKSCDEDSIDVLAILNTMKKHLKEEIANLELAKRDFFEQSKHLDWIISQLPEEVSEEEIEVLLDKWLNDNGEKNVGKIMAYLKTVFKDKTLDMKLASQIIRNKIS